MPPGQERMPSQVIPAGKEHVWPGVGLTGQEGTHPPQLGLAHSHRPALQVQDMSKALPHPQLKAAGHVWFSTLQAPPWGSTPGLGHVAGASGVASPAVELRRTPSAGALTTLPHPASAMASSPTTFTLPFYAPRDRRPSS